MPQLTRGGCEDRARYYHTDLQRFISEDPIEFGGGDTNLYAYVRNNPVRFTDATGLVVDLSRSSSELNEALALIRATKRGRELYELMEKDSRTCQIIALPGSGVAARPRGTCDIHIDPHYHPEVPTLAGRKLASTARVLAHEMGHAATNMILESHNVPLNENAVVRELGLSPRIYPDPPWWWYLFSSAPTIVERPRRP